jgi:hypothetical protein
VSEYLEITGRIDCFGTKNSWKEDKKEESVCLYYCLITAHHLAKPILHIEKKIRKYMCEF